MVLAPGSACVAPPGLMASDMARHRLALADHRAAQRDAVDAGLQLDQVVADVHRRRQEADVLRELLAHALDARQQVALARLVDQRDQPVADLQAQRVDRLQVVPAGFGVGRRGLRRPGRLALAASRGGALALLRQLPRQAAQAAELTRMNTRCGMPGTSPSSADDAGRPRPAPAASRRPGRRSACRCPRPCRRARPPSPTATEISSAGICATSASPIGQRDVRARRFAARSCRACAMPMTKPPTMVMNRISRPAIASPRTNLLAPSIDPKKSASSADFGAAAAGHPSRRSARH